MNFDSTANSNYHGVHNRFASTLQDSQLFWVELFFGKNPGDLSRLNRAFAIMALFLSGSLLVCKNFLHTLSLWNQVVCGGDLYPPESVHECVLTSQGANLASAESYSSMVLIFSEAGQCQRAEDTFAASRRAGHTPTPRAWSHLMRGYALAGAWEEALALLRAMREDGALPSAHVYSLALAACQRGRQWAPAERVFEDMAR